MTRELRAVSTILGDNFYLLGDEPTSFDASVRSSVL